MLDCECKKCCKRTHVQDGISLGCLCDIKLNYKFIYSFAVAMFFSVMVYGHTLVDMNYVNE